MAAASFHSGESGGVCNVSFLRASAKAEATGACRRPDAGHDQALRARWAGRHCRQPSSRHGPAPRKRRGSVGRDQIRPESRPDTFQRRRLRDAPRQEAISIGFDGSPVAEPLWRAEVKNGNIKKI